jgi:predicted RecA/RadA family phage recombinase
MKNASQSGDVLTLTAPTGGVVSGTPVKVGQLIVVPQATVAQTLPFAGARVGVFTGVAKATGAAWAEGELLYWNDTNKNFTKSSTGATLCAVAGAAAASGDATGTVVLLGIAAATT